MTHPINYNTQHLSLTSKRKLLNAAKRVSILWMVDVLDCSKSFTRQPVEMSWKEITAKLDGDCHFAFIERQGIGNGPDYFDVGFSTMGARPDYFLWIVLGIRIGKKLAERFKLKPMTY